MSKRAPRSVYCRGFFSLPTANDLNDFVLLSEVFWGLYLTCIGVRECTETRRLHFQKETGGAKKLTKVSGTDTAPYTVFFAVL